MTQLEFNRYYKQIYKHYKVMTVTDRRLAYNDLMESAYQSGMITQRQRTSWGHPDFLETHREEIDCNSPLYNQASY